MGLEEILKQVEETGREREAAIIKETTNEVESKMAEARVNAKEAVVNIKTAVSYTHLTLPTKA